MRLIALIAVYQWGMSCCACYDNGKVWTWARRARVFLLFDNLLTPDNLCFWHVVFSTFSSCQNMTKKSWYQIHSMKSMEFFSFQPCHRMPYDFLAPSLNEMWSIHVFYGIWMFIEQNAPIKIFIKLITELCGKWCTSFFRIVLKIFASRIESTKFTERKFARSLFQWINALNGMLSNWFQAVFMTCAQRTLYFWSAFFFVPQWKKVRKQINNQ